jgi:hypothetical protein
LHTATYLKYTTMSARRAGSPIAIQDVFPDWTSDDRLGIVVDHDYGVIGASLLIQTAALLFYGVNRDRNQELKCYPELYAFLLERPRGDLAMFDFFPRRKEVIVPRDPEAVLEAINDRAITRLLVVDGAPGSHSFPWHERNMALDRIRSAYAYSPAARLPGADMVMTGDADTELNVEMTVFPDRLITMLDNWTEDDIREFEPQLLDHDVDFSTDEYIAYATERASEVSDDARKAVARMRAGALEQGLPVEQYRTLSVAESLQLLVPGPS